MPEVTTPVTISAKAAEEIKAVMQKQNKPDCSLRIYVAGGGCSGFQYGMQLSTQTEEGDQTFESSGVRVVVDPMSIQYLQGATVDWEGSMVGGGFRIENPNAVSSCGCGHSFQAKGQEAGEKSGGCGCGSGGCGSH